jgi:hypothetical protein
MPFLYSLFTFACSRIQNQKLKQIDSEWVCFLGFKQIDTDWYNRCPTPPNLSLILVVDFWVLFLAWVCFLGVISLLVFWVFFWVTKIGSNIWVDLHCCVLRFEQILHTRWRKTYTEDNDRYRQKEIEWRGREIGWRRRDSDFRRWTQWTQWLFW